MTAFDRAKIEKVPVIIAFPALSGLFVSAIWPSSVGLSRLSALWSLKSDGDDGWPIPLVRSPSKLHHLGVVLPMRRETFIAIILPKATHDGTHKATMTAPALALPMTGDVKGR